jgi:hypothetical protein
MRAALVAGVVLMAALAGCGGGGAPSDAKVRETATGFIDAIRARDGAKACSYLTANGQSTYSQLGDTPCASGVLAAGFATDAKLGSVRVQKDQATVTLREPSGALTTLLLKREGERWKVDSSS